MIKTEGTGQYGMLTPPRHLTAPLVFTRIRVCLFSQFCISYMRSTTVRYPNPFHVLKTSNSILKRDRKFFPSDIIADLIISGKFSTSQ